MTFEDLDAYKRARAAARQRYQTSGCRYRSSLYVFRMMEGWDKVHPAPTPDPEETTKDPRSIDADK